MALLDREREKIESIPPFKISIDMSEAKAELEELEQTIDRITSKVEYLNSLLKNTG